MILIKIWIGNQYDIIFQIQEQSYIYIKGILIQRGIIKLFLSQTVLCKRHSNAKGDAKNDIDIDGNWYFVFLGESSELLGSQSARLSSILLILLSRQVSLSYKPTLFVDL